MAGKNKKDNFEKSVKTDEGKRPIKSAFSSADLSAQTGATEGKPPYAKATEDKKADSGASSAKFAAADNGAGNKNIDGIKKLEGKELVESRKIVLDYIGEKDEPMADKSTKLLLSNKPERASRLLDGLISSKEKIKKSKEDEEKKAKNIEKFKRIKKSFDRISDASKRPIIPLKKKSMNGLSLKIKAAKELLNQNKELAEAKEGADKGQASMASKQSEERKRQIASKIRDIEQDSKAVREKEKEKQAKLRLKEKEQARKILELEAKRARVQKAKQIKEVNVKKKQTEKIKKVKRKKEKKNKRVKKIQNYKKNLVNIIKRIYNITRIKKLLKIITLILISIAVVIILLYSVYALLVLKFNYFQNTNSWIFYLIPVPAAISNVSCLEYKDYLLILKYLEAHEKSTKQDIKEKIVEEISLKALAKSYSLPFNVNNQKLKEEIKSRIMLEGDVNLIAYSRINKIYQLINEGEDFDLIGEKYGDEFGYINDEEDYNRIQEAMSNYKSGQISEIITSNEGYSIYKQENNNIKYIYVDAINLEEYISNFSSRTKVWILVD